MRIDLDQEEQSLLQSTLEGRLEQLRRELVHTDDRALHRGLALDITRLESLAGRIAKPS